MTGLCISAMRELGLFDLEAMGTHRDEDNLGTFLPSADVDSEPLRRYVCITPFLLQQVDDMRQDRLLLFKARRRSIALARPATLYVCGGAEYRLAVDVQHLECARAPCFLQQQSARASRSQKASYV